MGPIGSRRRPLYRVIMSGKACELALTFCWRVAHVRRPTKSDGRMRRSVSAPRAVKKRPAAASSHLMLVGCYFC